jgi:1-acyl-sn-glycerol-3-phosphate acyltransferase
MNQPASNLHRFIRFIIFNLVRLFYPRLEVKGIEKAPAGPVIFVLNHPNGLIDPLLLMIGLQRPVSFLAKSTLFGNPIGKTLCQAFGALPIHRQRDEGKHGGPHGDAPERNEKIFAHCRALLRQGGAMALFPEGATHSGSELLPLKTGAARIALSAEAETNWQLNAQITPVGLWYESKTHFRTSALLVVGQPFGLADFAAAYTADEYRTVQNVTGQIEAGLDQVVLQAENAELLAAIPVLAAWVAPNGQPLSLAQQHDWTARLLDAYHYLQQNDPDRLESIAWQARSYANTLQTLGIADPWLLERPMVVSRPLVWLLVKLVITLPLALAGAALSYIPYRLAGPIATWGVGRYDTQTSTVKLILGAVFVLLAWIIEAILVGRRLGVWWGGLLLAAAPGLGYTSLRWGEDWRKVRVLISSRWLRWRRGQLVESLMKQRQHLAQQVLATVEMTPQTEKSVAN